MLELRFGFVGEQWTLEAIGKELGLTRERVRQIEARALTRLQHQLKDVVHAAGGDVVLAAWTAETSCKIVGVPDSAGSHGSC